MALIRLTCGLLLATCISGNTLAASRGIANPAMFFNRAAAASETVDLTNGLVAYWPMDEASDGTVQVDREDVVGGITMTDNNTVASGTGKIGNGADFELSNTGEYMFASDGEAAPVDFGGNQSFTIALWFKLETANTVSPQHLVAKYNPTGNNRSYRIVYDHASGIRFTLYTDGINGDSAEIQGTLSTGTWYFLVAWHDADGDTINIQLNNGTPVSTSWSGGVFNGTAQLTFGARTGPTDRMDGVLDEVGFWSRVLNADERTALYNSGNGLAYPFE